MSQTIYKLTGILADSNPTPFLIIIEKGCLVMELQLKVKEQVPHLKCAGNMLKIYKINKNPMSKEHGPCIAEEEEKGFPVNEVAKLPQTASDLDQFNCAAKLDGTWSLDCCWSRSPDSATRVHFVVVVPEDCSKTETLQVTVNLTLQDIAEISRKVLMSLKINSTIRDLSTQLRELPLPARSAFHFYDPLGVAIEDDKLLIDGGIYQARFDQTPPAMPTLPDSTCAVQYIYRTRAIKTILTKMMHENVVWVRAPPACGKTTIAKQVQERYAFYFKDTYFINLSIYRDPSTAMDQIFMDYPILLELGRLAKKQETTLIIIDEAQTLNCIDEKHSFWGELKTVIDSSPYNKSLYILMFGVYGEGPSSIRTFNCILSSPITIPTLDFPTIHLDDQEFDLMVDRFNNRTMGIQLNGSCRNYIHNFLGGHIGLVTHLLKYLDENSNAHNLWAQVPADEFQSLNFITEHAFEDLLNIRSIPTIGFLNMSEVPCVVEVMQMLLLNGGSFKKALLGKQYDQAIAYLLTSYCITSNQGRWTFASPFIQFALLRTWRIPANGLPDFHEFIQHCIQSLAYAKLGQSQSSSPAGLVHEDPFKCTLYATMPWYLPREQQVDPEVGRFFGSTGCIDLWIWPAKWAIKILRNYNTVKEHVNRFSTTYSPLPIEKHIVLNFVQEEDCFLQKLTVQKISQHQRRNQMNVWHIHWSPQARLIVLRRNTQPEERLPILEKPLVIEPAAIFPTTVV